MTPKMLSKLYVSKQRLDEFLLDYYNDSADIDELYDSIVEEFDLLSYERGDD